MNNCLASKFDMISILVSSLYRYVKMGVVIICKLDECANQICRLRDVLLLE